MPRRRIVIASMMHETNTFSPVPTPLESFRPLSGDAAIAEFKNTNTQVGASSTSRSGWAPRLPIAVGLDFHTQLTSTMVENATVITGHRTYPHIDMAGTAQRAAKTLVRVLDGEVKPVMAWGIRPMLTNTLEHTPSRQPMRDVMDMAIDAERRTPARSAGKRTRSFPTLTFGGDGDVEIEVSQEDEA
jgi:microcystin degradation protein MlrC